MVAVRDSELNIFRGNGVSLEGGQTQNVQYSQSPSLPRETKFIGFENNSGINSALFTDITPNGSIMAIDNVLFTPGCDAIVSTDQSYMTDYLTLGNYFSFDAWWEIVILLGPELVALQTPWFAIASTRDVDAYINTNTFPADPGVPIYNLAGDRIARGNQDLWDGRLEPKRKYQSKVGVHFLGICNTWNLA